MTNNILELERESERLRKEAKALRKEENEAATARLPFFVPLLGICGPLSLMVAAWIISHWIPSLALVMMIYALAVLMFLMGYDKGFHRGWKERGNG